MNPTQTTKVMQFLKGDLAAHFRLMAERQRADELAALCGPILELARRTPGEHPAKLVVMLEELVALQTPAAAQGGQS